MRLGSVIRYNLYDRKNGTIIFFSIMLIIMFLVITIFSTNNARWQGATETSFAIFLFIAGLNSFKKNFLYLSTNGITRKTQFMGFMISSLILSVSFSIVGIIYGEIFSNFINYNSTLNMIYNGSADKGIVVYIVEMFIWNMFLFLFADVLGYLITILYYRMSKLLKIIVSVGVPAFFTFILPIIDVALDGAINRLISRITNILLGGNPIVGSVSFMVGSAFVASLAYLLMRRAAVKE